ncbi:MAG: BMP family ABC transporter substrate-binding protein [Gaiellales bacterium]
MRSVCTDRTWLLVVVAAAAVLAVTDGTAARAPMKVGLIVAPPGVSDPFLRGPYQGLRRAVRELGIDGRVLTYGLREGPGPAYASLARQGYDLIIGVGFLDASALDRVARSFPRSRFVIVDASVNDLAHRPRNVRGVVFNSEEAAYLAGYLAALIEQRRPGEDVVGTVGGVKIPSVDSFIAGFQAGARKGVRGIRTLNAYAGDFLNERRCAAVAREQIARRAGVIFAVAGGCGVGALRAAKAARVWGIGVDVDQSFLGRHILTSVVKRLDVATFTTIRAFQRGQLRFGRDSSFRLRDQGVGLARISPDVPHEFLRGVERIRREIVAGKIRVPARLRD